LFENYVLNFKKVHVKRTVFGIEPISILVSNDTNFS